MGLQIPEPHVLLSKETSDGFYRLLQDIRNADTSRELIIYAERFWAAEREFREMFSLLSREVGRKMREFRDADEQALAERSGHVPHIDQREDTG